ncbi:hypothetical protein M8C21_018871 [Ambrosia artemisiifolia]|uniref:non-specific serine/threonine protein kinase n=1 Tax=Ambrosia artemisiifolia TaxID=4212 RepID=A0AAD5BKH3_AMBAR|nr:hypothetical protein M8C21_018871 [Ambrosia artemisiifolia]
MDDNIYQNTRYIESLQGNTSLPPLYTTTRLSPLALTSAIVWKMGRMVRRDFNIEEEAGGFGRPAVVPFNASVTDNTLEIRFYWAGKGTTRFPTRGVYGPLVSSIDVDPYFKTCSIGGKKTNKGVYIGVGLGVSFLVLLILVILWWKCLKGQKKTAKDFEGMELKTLSFSLKQLKTATNNFNASNKVGERGYCDRWYGGCSEAAFDTFKAGKSGYMAPEYALWGYLSDKADVYSYGVVLLEIVSGKSNTSYIPTNDCICLLDWACRLETSKQYEELFDQRLESTINKEEAETVVKVALLCTNGSPSMRPTMSEVVNMLDGKTCVPEIVPEASGYSEDLRFKAMRDFRREMKGQGSYSGSQTQISNTIRTETNYSLTSSYDAFEIQSVDTRLY